VDEEVSYPPEPWDLTGHGYFSLWLVPAGILPALPPRVRPVTLFGRVLVATAFVDYLPGSLLQYHELLVAVLVRRGLRIGLTITDIWVDSPASRAGARALWGIPKDLAEFSFTHGPTFDGSMKLGDTVPARARMRSGRTGLRLPFPAKATVFQSLGTELARTPVTAQGRVSLARGAWNVSGPLAGLRPHRPLLSVSIKDFKMRFGPRAR
jgi:hypothetical protein